MKIETQKNLPSKKFGIIIILLLIVVLLSIAINATALYKLHTYKQLQTLEQNGAKELAINFVTLRNTITLNKTKDVNQYRNTPINILPNTFNVVYQEIFDKTNPYNEYDMAIKANYTTSVKIIKVEVANNKSTIHFLKIYTGFNSHKFIKTDAMVANLWYWYNVTNKAKMVNLSNRYYLTAYTQDIVP